MAIRFDSMQAGIYEAKVPKARPGATGLSESVKYIVQIWTLELNQEAYKLGLGQGYKCLKPALARLPWQILQFLY